MLNIPLLRLLGGNKKYLFFCVELMLLGLTASICRAMELALHYREFCFRREEIHAGRLRSRGAKRPAYSF